MTGRPVPEAFLDTPLGRLRAWALTDADLRVTTMTAHERTDPRYRDHACVVGVAEHITLDGTPYTLSARLYHPEGEEPRPPRLRVHRGWALDVPATGLTRCDTGQPAAPSAREDVAFILLPALVAWADSQRGRDLLAAAAHQTVERQIERFTSDIKQLEEQRARLARTLQAKPETR